jgi:hypothetical protein
MIGVFERDGSEQKVAELACFQGLGLTVNQLHVRAFGLPQQQRSVFDRFTRDTDATFGCTTRRSMRPRDHSSLAACGAIDPTTSRPDTQRFPSRRVQMTRARFSIVRPV